jgi:hypothetical protein
LIAIVHFPSSPTARPPSVEIVKIVAVNSTAARRIILWFSRFGVAVPMRDTVVERQAYSWTEGPEQVFRPALDGGGIFEVNPNRI